jgi:prepilin-type N-terminal cleavage/methylation domain-containing protein
VIIELVKVLGKKRFTLWGFTLIELMISMIIVAVVSVIGVNALVSNIASTNMITSAQDVAAFLKQARSYAITQGCRTRIIICNNKHCENAATERTGSQPAVGFTDTSGKLMMGLDSSTPAHYYGLLINSVPCASADQNSNDGYNYWDFDKNPMGSLATGIEFCGIYTGNNGALDSNDGTLAGTTLSFGVNSLWFDPSLNPSTGTIPATNNHTSTGNTIAFQLCQEKCNPANSDDCMGYFVTISPGGVTGIARCTSGGRAESTDKCF